MVFPSLQKTRSNCAQERRDQSPVRAASGLPRIISNRPKIFLDLAVSPAGPGSLPRIPGQLGPECGALRPGVRGALPRNCGQRLPKVDSQRKDSRNLNLWRSQRALLGRPLPASREKRGKHHVGSTSTEALGCRLRVSEDLFRLTTESLRLHSNATFAHQTLATLIEFRAFEDLHLHDHELATLGEHLSIVPGPGEISLDLDLAARSLGYLEALRTAFSQKLRTALALEDALSLLLFDYVVEQKASKVLKVLDIETKPTLPSSDGGSRH